MIVIENNIDILIDLEIGCLNIGCEGSVIYYEFEFYQEILN